jgi:hypothetical protein
MAELVEHLPSKCEALSSNPNTTKKKKKGKTFVVGLHRDSPSHVCWKEHFWILQIIPFGQPYQMLTRPALCVQT